MANTNKFTVRTKDRNYDLRYMTGEELKYLRSVLIIDIQDIGEQIGEQLVSRNKGDNWKKSAIQASKIKKNDIDKINRVLQGRADRELEYMYLGDEDDYRTQNVKQALRKAMTDLVPDEVINNVIRRVESELEGV